MAGRRDIDRLHDEIQELFADLWQVPRYSGLRRGYRPQVDCYVTPSPPQLHVVVELPGVDPELVRVEVLGRTLVVSGERHRPRIDGAQYQQLELEYGPFQRRIDLPADVDCKQADARYERGMLEIVLPLSPTPPRPEKVAIEVKR